jgi:hypothetical protein
VQGGKLVRQAPALERASLIKGANLLPQKRQEVYRIEDHVGLLVGSTVACDLFGAAADDDVMDIVAGEGHDDRISVMETSNLSRGR